MIVADLVAAAAEFLGRFPASDNARVMMRLMGQDAARPTQRHSVGGQCCSTDQAAVEKANVVALAISIEFSLRPGSGDGGGGECREWKRRGVFVRTGVVVLSGMMRCQRLGSCCGGWANAGDGPASAFDPRHTCNNGTHSTTDTDTITIEHCCVRPGRCCWYIKGTPSSSQIYIHQLTARSSPPLLSTGHLGQQPPQPLDRELLVALGVAACESLRRLGRLSPRLHATCCVCAASIPRACPRVRQTAHAGPIRRPPRESRARRSTRDAGLCILRVLHGGWLRVFATLLLAVLSTEARCCGSGRYPDLSLCSAFGQPILY